MNWIRNLFRNSRSSNPALAKMIESSSKSVPTRTFGQKAKDLALGTALYGGLGTGLTAFDYSGYNPLGGSAEFMQEAGPVERSMSGLTNAAGAYGLAQSLRKGRIGWAGGSLLGLLGNAPLFRHSANVSDLAAKATEDGGNLVDKMKDLNEGLLLIAGNEQDVQGAMRELNGPNVTADRRKFLLEYIKKRKGLINTAASTVEPYTNLVNTLNTGLETYAKPIGVGLSGLGGAALGAIASSYLSDPVLPGESKQEAKKKIYANRLNHLLSTLAGGAAGVGGALMYDHFSKKANETAYPGYKGLAVQNFAPVATKRELTDEDRKLIAEGKSQWFPGLFASEGDPMTYRMASPLKQSLLAGLATTLGGAAAGGMFANNTRGSAYSGALLGGGMGALAGLPAAVLTYLSQDQENRSIEDRMKRLPEGSTTIRDMMSDPVTGMQERMRYDAPRQRGGSSIAQAALLAALMSRR